MKARNRNYRYFADWVGGYERIDHIVFHKFHISIVELWLRVFKENYTLST